MVVKRQGLAVGKDEVWSARSVVGVAGREVGTKETKTF